MTHFQQLLPHLINEINTPAIQRDIAAYWGFRSTVPGPGLTAASEFLARRYSENGIQIKIHAYPADDASEDLDGHKNPLAWFPRMARLEIAAPGEHAGLICDFAHEPLCLHSNSEGHFPQGIAAEVVVIHNATTPEAYANLDVSGKLVFTDIWPLLADEQARAHGALGILTDCVAPPWQQENPPVRSAADVPDLTMWGVLNGHRCEHPLFGFSLSPRQGTRLRKLIREAKEPVRLRVMVEAALLPGTSELVTALLPGSDPVQEVWILSHSSEPGALDDASGCCISLEIARTLKTLIDVGKLPAPHRSIRFLSAVETEGYLPYLAAFYRGDKGKGWEEISTSNEPNTSPLCIVAALAFDSMGSDFRQSGGTFNLYRSPDDNPSFADDLLETMISAVAAEQNFRFTPDNYEIFPWQVKPCFPGNDNMIADGFFDIPTPMLACWPDKFYHSNQDTPDKLSQGSLARSAVIAAAYVYLLAAAGADETRWMANLTRRSWKRRLLDGAPAWQAVDAVKSILRLEPELADEVAVWEAELVAFAEREGMPVNGVASQAIDFPVEWQNVPLKPAHWKPPMPEQLSSEGQAKLASLCQEHPKVENVWRLLNGRRTAAEICSRTALPAEAAVTYLRLLLQEGWIS